jgi:RNA polymerase sigma-70 factor (sigma-E family)
MKPTVEYARAFAELGSPLGSAVDLARTGKDSMSDRDAEFEAFAAAHADQLRRTAYLLCGDWHFAADLTQTALLKIFLVWHRLGRRDRLEAYVRRTLVRCWLDERRKSWRRHEQHEADPSERADLSSDPWSNPTESTEDAALLAALARLPDRQRATLVLRYFNDLSVTQVAQAMRCSEGTIKSQTARALTALRAILTQSEAR